MNKLKYIIAFFGLAILMNGCMEPEEPTNVQILTGEWEVVSVIADRQVNFPPNVFLAQSVLHLDRNETFLFVNVDGRAKAGTWTASETELTLSDAEEGDVTFTIVYSDYNKMHVYYTITNTLTGDIELRYLFERIK
ncbi:MAG: hypothetical protein WC951_04090 [Bacteroidales bacterium]|nr:hypothetical protein [Tenuifilaceae bacterium]